MFQIRGTPTWSRFSSLSKRSRTRGSRSEAGAGLKPALILYFHFRKHLERIFLENLQFVFSAQELQAIDHGNQVVRRLSGFGANRATGAGGFRPEKHLIDTPLFDRGG